MVLSYFLPAGSSTPEHQYKAYYDNYDKLFKVQEQASGLTEFYDYDVVGNVLHHTDPMNNMQKVELDTTLLFQLIDIQIFMLVQVSHRVMHREKPL